jgi:hypothetical protein
MAKQIKVGFDKIPSPQLEQVVPLYDLSSGTPLTDVAGNIIVTEEPGLVGSFILSDKAASVYVNNEVGRQNLAVIEQFADSSEVSSSLLGVPRSEQQLSLFSDVSTYGIDEKDWEYYTVRDGRITQLEWETRRHPFYGKRKNVTFNEYTNEQALALEAFPVNYTYPFGPRFDTGSGNTLNNLYDEDLFKQYLNFILIGKALYSFFASPRPSEPRGYKDYADSAFITDRIKIVDSAYTQITITESAIDALGNIIRSDIYDIDYGDDLELAYEEIERFSINYKELLNKSLVTPIVNFYISDLFKGISRLSDQTRPGYSDSSYHYGVLETKTEFRYQPGRISGFTYGIRLRNDPNSTSSLIEFGCVNETDQYVFKIEGSRFSIVRRSAISLLQSNPALQQRLGFTFEDEVFKYPPGLNTPNKLYELEIPREVFNGDSLDGNGPSGYILSLEDVTMFKIEFGWYGAIGAKFYAYIPTGNDGARWVLMHTLVIENGLGHPCLVNPNFRFRYALGVDNTSEIDEPIYVYKYGSSYYIDGGDEGTLRINSSAADQKIMTNNTPVIAILPKNDILNTDGVKVKNNMKIFPSSVAVNTDTDVRIDVKEIKGSPEGVHYSYSPSLKQEEVGVKGRTVDLTFSEDRSSVTLTSGVFASADQGAKIIADGVINCYIGEIDGTDPSTAKIERRNFNYNLIQTAITDLVRKSTGEELDPAGETFTSRLSNYDTIAASTIPIKAKNFKIHFLNPTNRDDFSHYADFAIAITSKQPKLVSNIDTGEQELKFGLEDEDFNLYDNTTNYIEWCPRRIGRNSRSGAESFEEEYVFGSRLDVDFRLPRPDGSDSGLISAVAGKVEIVEYAVTDVQADPNTGFQRLYFSSEGSTPTITEETIGISEIGVNGVATGITIQSTPQTLQFGGALLFYILVDGDVESVSGYAGVVQIKRIVISDNIRIISRDQAGDDRFPEKLFQVTSIQSFNVNDLYLVVALKDKAAVHNIVVEEITTQTTTTHTPNWITNDEDVAVFVGSGSSSRSQLPSNFIGGQRGSSARTDTQTQQPLRPGNTIYSFFLGENSSEVIDLSNIFGPDRRTIRTGTLNNLGTFFVASTISQAAGNIEASLTIKEQT